MTVFDHVRLNQADFKDVTTFFFFCPKYVGATPAVYGNCCESACLKTETSNFSQPQVISEGNESKTLNENYRNTEALKYFNITVFI